MTDTDDHDTWRDQLDGTGWYEFIRPGGSTTHIAYVYEDGSVYLPEGVDAVDETDFRMAAATGRFWKLVRVDARPTVTKIEVDQ